MMRKIAIIKNNKDIARISIFNVDDNNYEVKLSIFIDEFNIIMLEAFKRRHKIKKFKENDSEMTFHIAKEKLDLVIHLKRKNNAPFRLIEKNLVDFDTNIY